MHFGTFARYAKALKLYVPNQTRVGIVKDSSNRGTPLSLILDGRCPGYHSTKLKTRLIAENLIEEKCAACGLGPIWNGKAIALHLDHIDGDSTNHRLANLQLLCPNCHSQTNTYCGRNKKKGVKRELVTDEALTRALEESVSFNAALIKTGMKGAKPNYRRCEELCRRREDLATKYGVTLKENNVKASKKEISDARNLQIRSHNLHRVEALKDSGIDFKKMGWVTKAAFVVNISPQKVVPWLRRIEPSFLERCWLRKSPVC